MKINFILASVIFLTTMSVQAQNCGPGTSDPSCTAHNANREAAIKQEQQRRAEQEAKSNGTYGRIGENKTPSNNSTNDRPRAISK